MVLYVGIAAAPVAKGSVALAVGQMEGVIVAVWVTRIVSTKTDSVGEVGQGVVVLFAEMVGASGGVEEEFPVGRIIPPVPVERMIPPVPVGV